MTAFRGLFAALVAAQVAYGAAPRRSPSATRALVLLMLGTAMAEAAQARGWRRGLRPLAAAGGIGVAAELIGVRSGRLFGRYRYSGRLGPRVSGVPVLAAAAWALMARPAWVVAGRLARRRVARVPLAAGALTAWDVFLDPRMVREGYWTWPAGGTYEGVPLSNFVRNLGGTTGRFVIDKTGLTGPFDLELQWAPDQPAGGAQPDGVSLFAAMQEQLGLKLEAKRAPVEVLVIDSAERPTED